MVRALVTSSVGLLLGATLGVACNDGTQAMKDLARQGNTEPLCRRHCEHIFGCKAATLTESVANCVQGCMDDEDAWTAACREATIASIACHTALSCESLRPLYEAEALGPGDPCDAERKALDDCRPAREEFIYFQF
ncbi:MAG: hypothetical protein AAF799_03540 [Myxococcota bacterium]